jgi:hypothetical protein
MEAGLTLAFAYDNGSIMTKDDLVMDLPGWRNDFITGINDALNLSTEAGYVTTENAPRILVKGLRQALALAGESGFLEEGSIEFVMKRALANATALDKLVPAEPPS